MTDDPTPRWARPPPFVPIVGEPTEGEVLASLKLKARTGSALDRRMPLARLMEGALHARMAMHPTTLEVVEQGIEVGARCLAGETTLQNMELIGWPDLADAPANPLFAAIARVSGGIDRARAENASGSKV